MAFKLVKRDKLPVPVKGSIKGEDGKPVPFDFTLHCIRLSQDEINAALKDKDESVTAFVQRIATGWQGVLDEHGEPLPFTEDSLAEVLANPGMAAVCSQAYLNNVGAVAKN